MSKNKGGGDFSNRAAKKFRQPDKVDLMAQEEIFDILEEDISTMLEQITANRNRQGKFPTYIANAFGNLSTVLWFQKYVEEHCRVKKGKLKSDLSDDDVESLKTILADAYKKSATNFYSNMTQEFKERNKMLGKTFIILSPKVYALTKKLGLTKSQRRDLTIQVFGDPVNNFKFVHKHFNNSSISDKKKMKLLKKMYGKRFVAAVGAALTVDSNNSDCIAMLYDFVMKQKKRKRAPFILEYARAYKKNKSFNFRLSGGEFYSKNKPMIKELKKCDIGFKKAFKNLHGKGAQAKQKRDKSKDKKNNVEVTKF